MRRRYLALGMALVLAACGGPEQAPTLTPETRLPLSGAVATPTLGQPLPLDQPTAEPATTIPPPVSEPATAAPPSPEPLAPTATPAVQASAPTATTTSGAPSGPQITSPGRGATIDGSFRIAGLWPLTPFENSLVIELRDSEGLTLMRAGLQTNGEYGNPAPFDATYSYQSPASTRPGQIVLYEASAKDGSALGLHTIPVILAGAEVSGPTILVPGENAAVTLPVHVEAVGLEAGADYKTRIVWADGTVLEQQAPAYPSRNGGSVVTSLAWATESAPPNPDSQNATVEVLNNSGQVVARQPVFFANSADSVFVRPVKVYFWLPHELREVTRYVPATEGVATAALRELLWGPVGNELAAAGMTTMLPPPHLVAEYLGRSDEWTARAFLRSIRIENGVAYVDWSREMAAWGGGSAQLQALTQQVEATLRQFPSITSVVMTVEGSEEVLQP